jgi:hypothetical protein
MGRKTKISDNYLLAGIFSLALLPLVVSCALAQNRTYGNLNSMAGNPGVTIPVPPSAPPPSSIEAQLMANSDMARWSSLFGSVHKKITKSAMDTLNSPEFAIRRDRIISGSWSESGHPSMSADGGDVKAIWFGKSKDGISGGVLPNYEQFNSSDAYENIGIICHLTQDMAVPTHAANIPHGLFVHNDTFEGYKHDEDVAVPGGADGTREPWEYYQLLQDETRSKLPTWTDPATGKPYWQEADNRVPMGQDATYGAKGHYGGDQKNHDGDTYASGDKTANPEIHLQQLSAAALGTVNVVKAASRVLPPLVYNLKIEDRKIKQGQTARLSFGALDNHSSRLDCSIRIYRDGALIGEMAHGTLGMVAPKHWYMPYFSNQVNTEWTGMVDFKVLPPGAYMLEVKLTDEDGNVTPEEVNHDFMRLNDTKIMVTVI